MNHARQPFVAYATKCCRGVWAGSWKASMISRSRIGAMNRVLFVVPALAGRERRSRLKAELRTIDGSCEVRRQHAIAGLRSLRNSSSGSFINAQAWMPALLMFGYSLAGRASKSPAPLESHHAQLAGHPKGSTVHPGFPPPSVAPTAGAIVRTPALIYG